MESFYHFQHKSGLYTWHQVTELSNQGQGFMETTRRRTPSWSELV